MEQKKIGFKMTIFLVIVASLLLLSNTARAAGMLTGTHWASTSDYQNLKNAGFNFVVTTVSPTDPASWAQTLQAASSAGLKLIIGAYPAPYTLNSDGTWIISPDGIQFLNYLAANSSSVMAVFVFNEPYWTNPSTGVTNACGALSAANLQALRTTIQGVWSGAKIYDDIGAPQWWSPSGADWTSCIGNKYADQEGVADYVGIWSYPFTTSGFTESSSLTSLQSEANYVTNSMGAIPILLGQTFASPSNNLVYPTTAQLSKWNCDLRTISSAGGISWYVWNQSLYPDYLSNHPEDMPFITAANACTTPTPATSTATTSVTITPTDAMGLSQTFTVTLSDSATVNNIQGADVLINDTVNGENACWLSYNKSTNALSLADNATDAWSTLATLGSNTTLSNSQCSVTLSNVTVSSDANSITLTLPITFMPSDFAGMKNIYSVLLDTQASTSTYEANGTFEVLTPPTIVPIVPTPIVTLSPPPIQTVTPSVLPVPSVTLSVPNPTPAPIPLPATSIPITQTPITPAPTPKPIPITTSATPTTTVAIGTPAQTTTSRPEVSPTPSTSAIILNVQSSTMATYSPSLSFTALFINFLASLLQKMGKLFRSL